MHMRVLQHLGILALGFSLTINKKNTQKKSVIPGKPFQMSTFDPLFGIRNIIINLQHQIKSHNLEPL